VIILLGRKRRKALPSPRVLLAALVCFQLAFFPWMAAAAASSQPVTVAEFWQRVAETLAWLDSPHSAQEWSAQAAAWAQIDAVSLPDGQLVPVDTTEIVLGLRSEAPDSLQLKAYLSALQQMRDQWPPASCGDCKAGLLAEILARPEFQQDLQQPGPIEKFLQNVLDAISGWLNKLLGSSGGGIAISPEVLTVSATLLLAVVLVLIFRGIYRNMISEAELPGEMPGEDEILTARLASQKALELSAGGDYRHAMRYLYLSALLFLDEHSLLRYDRSLTNREYLRQVGSQPALAAALKQVVDDFDRVWYGFQPVDPSEYARYAEKVHEIEEMKA
jgi:hypothetical protein